MSFSSDTSSAVKCKSFISEEEIQERNKKRQEEWEKVRKPEDPLEVPEEEYDPRSLFERLQEQKDKKDAEYEESHRLKNLIKGLDDDEVAFLELVDKAKMEMETKLWNEEMKEIQEFKQAVANLSEKESEAKLNELRHTLRLQMKKSEKKTQQELLSGAVKRKASAVMSSPSPEKKQCLEAESPSADTQPTANNSVVTQSNAEVQSPTPNKVVVLNNNVGHLQCLGILPGLGAYTDSSDSDNSSLSDMEKESEYDLIGRKKVCVVAAQPQSKAQPSQQ